MDLELGKWIVERNRPEQVEIRMIGSKYRPETVREKDWAHKVLRMERKICW